MSPFSGPLKEAGNHLSTAYSKLDKGLFSEAFLEVDETIRILISSGDTFGVKKEIKLTAC